MKAELQVVLAVENSDDTDPRDTHPDARALAQDTLLLNGINGPVPMRPDGLLDARWLPAVTQSQRGFQRAEPVPGTYGGYVEVYESSAASGPHLWVEAAQPKDLNAYATGADLSMNPPTTIHLTAKAARDLRDRLDYMLRTHYQGDCSSKVDA